ncbi:hypothetical protein NPIL_555321 [Nephila pilipes]|uniref:Uncharacterized protein n=1 Tax=Nephila pilipes TaxID=299642 RepID=A0A8X6TWN1_NEPPI|nr:hypothetical protein NPIL_555321 [Nephila pilipes]
MPFDNLAQLQVLIGYRQAYAAAGPAFAAGTLMSGLGVAAHSCSNGHILTFVVLVQRHDLKPDMQTGLSPNSLRLHIAFVAIGEKTSSNPFIQLPFRNARDKESCCNTRELSVKTCCQISTHTRANRQAADNLKGELSKANSRPDNADRSRRG